ncbi:ArsR/SmtB family transcription factor [Nonomuraea sp. NPDC050383]|uniref:ArsR/SmtB family transcription factor n=1 Tax=Nonomuraea sp. NPDC050383 TaxID=3364362 RepID=UPI0037B7D6EB
MRQLPHPATEAIQLTEVLRALADPVRLEIAVRLATQTEQNCSSVLEELGVHKSTASHHYRTLREAGVLLTRQDGRQKYMRLRREDLDTRFPGLLDTILRAALTDVTTVPDALPAAHGASAHGSA